MKRDRKIPDEQYDRIVTLVKEAIEEQDFEGDRSEAYNSTAIEVECILIDTEDECLSVNLTVRCYLDWEDDSFDHEFGTYYDYSWHCEKAEVVDCDGDWEIIENGEWEVYNPIVNAERISKELTNLY